MEPDLGSWRSPDISRSHLHRGTIAWTPPTAIYRAYTVMGIPIEDGIFILKHPPDNWSQYVVFKCYIPRHLCVDLLLMLLYWDVIWSFSSKLSCFIFLWFTEGMYTILTHCGLVMSLDDIELGQHWLRQWLVARQHQAITWTMLI